MQNNIQISIGQMLVILRGSIMFILHTKTNDK